VFQHRATLYVRTFRGSVFSTFVLPILFLLGMGVSVGAYVDATGSLGIPYVDYIAPGVLASTALQVAVGESTWPVLGAFQWVRTYHAMRASPLRPQDIVGGEILYILLRAGTSAVGFLTVMAIFGTVHSWWAVAAPAGGPPARGCEFSPRARVLGVYHDGQHVRDPVPIRGHPDDALRWRVLPDHLDACPVAVARVRVAAVARCRALPLCHARNLDSLAG
jgi:hypothetical protein